MGRITNIYRQVYRHQSYQSRYEREAVFTGVEIVSRDREMHDTSLISRGNRLFASLWAVIDPQPVRKRVHAPLPRSSRVTRVLDAH